MGSARGKPVRTWRKQAEPIVCPHRGRNKRCRRKGRDSRTCYPVIVTRPLWLGFHPPRQHSAWHTGAFLCVWLRQGRARPHRLEQEGSGVLSRMELTGGADTLKSLWLQASLNDGQFCLLLARPSPCALGRRCSSWRVMRCSIPFVGNADSVLRLSKPKPLGSHIKGFNVK